MIHYVTIHFETTCWVDLQINHIAKNTDNYKIWALYGYRDADCKVKSVIDVYGPKFEFFKAHHVSKNQTGSKTHWQLLNQLTDIVLSDSSVCDDDIIIWLDSDCLPINNINEFVKRKLKHTEFSAIQRVENIHTKSPNGDQFPHPSFAFCTVGFCRLHKLKWDGIVDCERIDINSSIQDTGGSLLCYFNDNNIKWSPIRRSQGLTMEMVLFSIYGDVVYHHGGGTREILKGELLVRSDLQLCKGNICLKYYLSIRQKISSIIKSDIEDGYFLSKYRSCNLQS